MSNRLKLLREKAVRPRRTVPVLLDGTLREQIEAVQDELDRLDASADEPDNDRRLVGGAKSPAKRIKELTAELDRLYAEAEQSTLYVVLEGLQRTPYRALMAQHPPRVDENGKPLLADLQIGANAETIAPALARACIIGYRETPETDSPVKPFPSDLVDDRPNNEEVTAGWLLGFSYPDPDDPEKRIYVEGFCTPRQVARLGTVAYELCGGDDAVPLRRQRSTTPPSAEG